MMVFMTGIYLEELKELVRNTESYILLLLSDIMHLSLLQVPEINIVSTQQNKDLLEEV